MTAFFQVCTNLCRLEKILGKIGNAVRIPKQLPSNIDRATKPMRIKPRTDAIVAKIACTELVIGSLSSSIISS